MLDMDRRLVPFIPLLTTAFALVSCGEQGGTQIETPSDNAPTTITVDVASINAEVEGQTLSVTITSPTRPAVKSDQAWVKITDGTYKDYKITVGVDVQANKTTSARSASISIVAGSLSKTIPVSQAGVDNTPREVSLSLSSYNCGAAGGSVSVDVTSPTAVTITGAPDWVSVEEGSFADFKQGIKISVSANPSQTSRKAELAIRSGDLSAAFTITQSGKTSSPGGGITTTIVTRDAIPAAQALYDYLLSQYGKKTISSVIASVNWNHDEADKVYAATGKYPAINCYDFIQIYVPEGNGWIDYNDLRPVTQWHDAGGIVSLMWHFNVPKTETTVPKTDGSGVTCTPGETTFRAANALKDGTWENKWFYGQMDKVVSVLLQLQDAGIAALWRPFHEAAGNSTYKTPSDWTTSWFWWGFDGAETYRKLWVAMFDYFASKGVRNLIWIWTTQNYNGDPAKYNLDSDWYPGDSYVDIVGRDLYGQDAVANATEFSQIQENYPTKMVTLAECGKNGAVHFSDVSAFWESGAKWSYFMPWYGSNMPDDAWWKNAMGSSVVVTREDLPSTL